MSRAKWKGPFIDLYTLKKKKIYPNLWLRSSIIPFEIVNTIVCVHNGRDFRRVIVTKEKVGSKLGEFSFTRKLQSRDPAKNVKKKKHLIRKK
jgi:small subunit ribosomal protein S19